MAFLIDLEKVYHEKLEPGCAGLRELIERSIREVFCRHCEDAPCVLACPQDALKKVDRASGGEELRRSNFLCTGCRSCLIGCPFGVNIDELVEYERRPSVRLDHIARECPWVEKGEFQESDDIVRIEGDLFVRAVNWRKQLGLPAG